MKLITPQKRVKVKMIRLIMIKAIVMGWFKAVETLARSFQLEKEWRRKLNSSGKSGITS